jgi:hypothetical protein
MIAPHVLQVRETLLGKRGYAAPADACISYQTLYRTLTAFRSGSDGKLLVQLSWRDMTHDAATLPEVPSTAPESLQSPNPAVSTLAQGDDGVHFRRAACWEIASQRGHC